MTNRGISMLFNGEYGLQYIQKYIFFLKKQHIVQLDKKVLLKSGLSKR